MLQWLLVFVFLLNAREASAILCVGTFAVHKASQKGQTSEITLPDGRQLIFQKSHIVLKVSGQPDAVLDNRVVRAVTGHYGTELVFSPVHDVVNVRGNDGAEYFVVTHGSSFWLTVMVLRSGSLEAHKYSSSWGDAEAIAMERTARETGERGMIIGAEPHGFVGDPFRLSLGMGFDSGFENMAIISPQGEPKLVILNVASSNRLDLGMRLSVFDLQSALREFEYSGSRLPWAAYEFSVSDRGEKLLFGPSPGYSKLSAFDLPPYIEIKNDFE